MVRLRARSVGKTLRVLGGDVTVAVSVLGSATVAFQIVKHVKVFLRPRRSHLSLVEQVKHNLKCLAYMISDVATWCQLGSVDAWLI
jgi:hypothetical protein